MNCGPACMSCLLKNAYDFIKDNNEDESLNKQFITSSLKILLESNYDVTAPYLLYKLTNLYEDTYKKKVDYSEIKHDFNNLVLSNEKDIKEKIKTSNDPLKTSIIYSRIGNYIDFGAMEHVSKKQFLSLFDDEKLNILDELTYQMFLKDCETSNTFLLTADNCGEIVLDRFFIEELRIKYPHLDITLLVKGEDISNDATLIDAEEAGFIDLCRIITTGNGIPGSDPRYLSNEARQYIDKSDIIFSKGQANFETLSLYGKNTYYSFLCKCDYFANKFNVPKLTGMFINEKQLKTILK